MTTETTPAAETVTETSAPATHALEADVARLLHMMVHSVYSDKTVFLRELISNAADACEKLRYEALSAPELLGEETRTQIAEYTRTMHDHRFTHNDLKWRNLLIDDQQTLYLIDCPNGDFWRGFWLKYRITKDLACLDKVAKYHLSATQRLRFYLQYRRRKHLSASDKQRIRHVLKFFEGRE